MVPIHIERSHQAFLSSIPIRVDPFPGVYTGAYDFFGHARACLLVLFLPGVVCDNKVMMMMLTMIRRVLRLHTSATYCYNGSCGRNNYSSTIVPTVCQKSECVTSYSLSFFKMLLCMIRGFKYGRRCYGIREVC
jgi:hypothetical protein